MPPPNNLWVGRVPHDSPPPPPPPIDAHSWIWAHLALIRPPAIDQVFVLYY